MATDLERLVVQLSADVRGYQREMQRMQGFTARNTKAIQSQFSKMNRSMSAEFLSFGKTAAGVYASLAAGREIKQLSDAATRIDNALKVAGLSGAELEKVYQRLFESATKNAAPIESLVTLYSRAAQVQKELGVSTEELAKFTDNVAVALRVNGRSAQESQGALLQLGQALGSARVFAEEFNSINEGARPILQAVAAGIKEAGGSVSKLKQLVIEGKVSNQAFFRGFQAGAVTLREQVASSVLTVDQAFSNFQTSLIDIVRDFNKATGASESFAKGINNVAVYMGQLDVSGFIGKIQSAKAAIDDALKSAGNAQVFKDFNEAMGITQDGELVNPQVQEAQDKVSALEREVKLLQDTIAKNTNLGFDNTEALARLGQVRTALAALRSEAASLPGLVNGVRPDGTPIPFAQTNGLMGGSTIRGGKRVTAPVASVSLSDFPVTGTTKTGKAKVNEFDEAVKSANEATKALQQQEAAMRGLDGASANYAQKVAAIEKAQELLNSAQEGGKAIAKEFSDINQVLYGDLSKLSPAAREQALKIRELSSAYADATTKLDTLKEAQDKAATSAKEAIEFQKDLVNGALSDMRTALEDGKLTWEDLGNVAVNVLNKIADRLQQMLVDQLFAKGLGGLFGAATGGLGSVIGSGASYFPPAPSAPALPSMAAAKAASSAVDVRVSVDDEGALRAYVQKEGRRTEARVAAGSKATLDKYARGQGRMDAQDAVRRPRRIGVT